MSEEILQRINKRRPIKSEIKVPPILDKDSSLAASFLSLIDREEWLVILQDIFLSLGQESQKHKALEEVILDNEANYDWFVNFALVLNQLANEGREFFIPSKSEVEFRTDLSELRFLPPINHSGRKVSVRKIKVKDNNIISMYRVLYIKEGFSLSDFEGGFPAWYTLSSTTLYEEYNPKTNKRVRIDFKNGEFYYFLAGASDNWVQIVDVPLEMDSVISSLLFRQ